MFIRKKKETPRNDLQSYHDKYLELYKQTLYNMTHTIHPTIYESSSKSLKEIKGLWANLNFDMQELKDLELDYPKNIKIDNLM